MEKTKGGKVSLSVETCSMKYVNELIEDSKKKPVWDDKTGQNYLEYTKKKVLHKIWIESKSSLELKMKEVDAGNLAGYAFWKYGMENKDVWNMIAGYTG